MDLHPQNTNNSQNSGRGQQSNKRLARDLDIVPKKLHKWQVRTQDTQHH